MIACISEMMRRDPIAALFRDRWGWLLAFGIVQVIAEARSSRGVRHRDSDARVGDS